MSKNSQYACLPILSSSKDYAKWSLAIKGQAKLTNIWRVYASMWTKPSPIAATATQEVKDAYNIENKEWVKAKEKATGLLWHTVTKDLQLVLNNHQVVITAATTTTVAVTKEANTHELWELLKTHFKKKDGISRVLAPWRLKGRILRYQD
jgi:hypothetical protein